MSEGTLRSVIGSSLTALPWCCIAPAAFAASGVVTAGVGTALGSATPLFLVVSVAFLTRALYMALAKRQRPLCVRALVVGSTPLIVGFWAFRLGFWF